MTPQFWVFYLYLALAALVALVFLEAAASSRRPGDVEARAVQRLRAGLFVVLTALVLAALAITLGRLPYTLHAEELPDRVIFVAGKQFAFAVTEAPVADDEAWLEATSGAPAVEVPAGSLVEFRVTALDVNHGVGIFDPAGVLIGQVQGMPGYVNRLRMRLERPGRYDVLCLELCGNLHSRMRGVVLVTGS
jgi:cytochrome c oxidase subunit 2